MPCENVTSCHAVNATSVTAGLADFANTTLDITSTISPTTLTNSSSITPFTVISPVTNTNTFPITLNTTTNFSATFPSTLLTNTTSATPREDPVTLDESEVVLTLCLSLFVILTNVLVLFLTKFAGGGQSPTMVFVRMLCVSDFFLGLYGLGKMLMFLFVDGLMINFFLPESLFFTATTASCLSLLLLNMDRCIKMVWPLWYAQNMDKPSIITGMVFLWNVSFVLGFVPLLGWNSQHETFLYDLFHFFPWHYLLLMGLVWVLCIGGSLAILLWVRGRFDLTLQDQGHLSYHLTEVEKYCKLRVTIVVDIITWILCYLPFLLFLGLACDVCLLGGRSEVKVVVYHFVPVFMLRSLGGAGLQLYRTVRVQGLVKLQGGAGSITSPGHRLHHHHHHHRFPHKRLEEEENGVSAISYSNPLWEDNLGQLAALGNAFSTLPLDSYGTNHARGEEEQQKQGAGGISNPAYRPSIQLEVGQGLCGVTEEITAL